MRIQKLSGAASLGLLVILTSSTLQASILAIYSDRASWEGMTTGRTDINFDSLGLATGTWQYYNTAAGVTAGGVQFTGWNGNNWELLGKNPAAGWGDDLGTGSILQGPTWITGSYLMATLPTGVTSFGLDIAGADPVNSTFRILLDGIDAGITIVGPSRPGRGFFGVRTDSAISTVRIEVVSGNATFSYALIDNVSYGVAGSGSGGGGGEGNPGETPEVGTLVAVGTGLFLLSSRRRRTGATAFA